MYAKAHPFGYIKQKTRKKKDVSNYRPISHIQTIRLSSTQVKTIYHVNPAKRGRTLAEMVYESFKN